VPSLTILCTLAVVAVVVSQAMDQSHVSLVALNLRKDGFDNYRCDRPVSLGLNMLTLGKVLKCAGNDDVITLNAPDAGDTISFVFETEKADKVSDFELKLMQIDQDHLGIPDTEYSCNVTMPSGEFQKICRDLSVLGDTCKIACTKEGIKFSVDGDLGTGNITHRATTDSDKKEEEHTVIQMDDPVALNFALNYLCQFTRATALSKTVHLRMSESVPLVVEYPMGDLGNVRFYLAPKIDGEGDGEDEG